VLEHRWLLSQPVDRAHEVCWATLRAMSEDRPEGERDSFSLRVQQELPSLYRYAISIVGDRERAEDLVSDTMLRAIERRDQYRGEFSLRTWLHSILYHLAIDRARHGVHEVSVDRVEADWRDDRYAVDPALVVERAQPAAALRDALSELPEGYRSVVVLHDAEGCSSGEVARVLDISLSATKQRLRRGRMMLVSVLAHGSERYVPDQEEMLGCWEARRLVSAYLDGELDVSTCARLEAHLGHCATCPPLYQALVGATSSLGELHDDDSFVPPATAERIRSRLASQ